jgi:hypothetical protein
LALATGCLILAAGCSETEDVGGAGPGGPGSDTPLGDDASFGGTGGGGSTIFPGSGGAGADASEVSDTHETSTAGAPDSAEPSDALSDGLPDWLTPIDAEPDMGAPDTDTPPGECGYGVIDGIICSPSDQVFVNGATVWVDATDCDGTPLHLEAISDGEGKYTLTGVPAGLHTVHVSKGTFSNQYAVQVEAGKTTDVSAVAYKACPKAFDQCATGTVMGNVCSAGALGPKGVGLSVYIDTNDCNGKPLHIQTTTGIDGSFQISGVPVGNQVVQIDTPAYTALELILIEPNKSTALGFLGSVACDEEDLPTCTEANGCKEPCDCVDNDGDGEVDEGCGFLWDILCHDGCDCIDNDGDGLIDEDCPENDCGAELCDCIDNDGDGKIDESCCDPGDWRYCDENLYCAWGKQTCKDDGSWTACKEIPIKDIPEPCQPYYDFDQEPVIYDKVCCVNAGFCCQDYPEWQSIGTCTESPCP